MNVNLSLGILSFIVWSTFSTWYYVNFIRHFDDEYEMVEISSTSGPKEPISEMSPADSVELLEVKKSLNLSRNILFRKNSTNLMAPRDFNEFSDSLTEAWAEKIQVKIVGYACDLGAEAYNLELSKKRAQAVAKILGHHTFEISNLSYKGESEPLVPNTTESNRMKNRRVHLQFTSK